MLLTQNPPSFTLSEPKPALLRSTSDEGPLRKLAPTEDFKRQSLMEPLTVPLTEPLLQTTPQVQQCTMSSLVYNSAVNECRECCVCSQSKLTLTVLINCQETTVKSTYMFEPSGASGFSSMG